MVLLCSGTRPVRVPATGTSPVATVPDETSERLSAPVLLQPGAVHGAVPHAAAEGVQTPTLPHRADVLLAGARRGTGVAYEYKK